MNSLLTNCGVGLVSCVHLINVLDRFHLLLLGWHLHFQLWSLIFLLQVHLLYYSLEIYFGARTCCMMRESPVTEVIRIHLDLVSLLWFEVVLSFYVELVEALDRVLQKYWIPRRIRSLHNFVHGSELLIFGVGAFLAIFVFYLLIQVLSLTLTCCIFILNILKSLF